MLETIFTFYIFIVMSIITIIHIYWLKGGLWPGNTKQDLIDKVIGKGENLPNTIEFVFVLIIFLALTILPIIIYYKIDIGIDNYQKYILLFFAMIFLLRGIAMFLPKITKTATKIFLEYNTKYYTPICLSLSISYFYLFNIY